MIFDDLLKKLAGKPAESTPRQDLDAVAMGIQNRAQLTLGHLDEAFDAFSALKTTVKRRKKAAEVWEDHAEESVRNMATCSRGSAQYGQHRELAKDALRRLAVCKQQVIALEEVVSATQPSIDRALAIVREVGLTTELALSQVESLRASLVSAESQKLLADETLFGEASDLSQQVQKAKESVTAVESRAAAEQEVVKALDLDSQIDTLARAIPKA